MVKYIKILLFVAIIPLFMGCFGNWGNRNDQNPDTIDNYKPVVISRTELESSVATLQPQATLAAGKLYIKDNLMFLNEKNKGFHVFNYTDAQNPIKIGFIKTIGATDLAIRNNILYINQAVDLLTVEYFPASNSIVIKNRNRDVFPQKKSPFGNDANVNPNDIVVDWRL